MKKTSKKSLKTGNLSKTKTVLTIIMSVICSLSLIYWLYLRIQYMNPNNLFLIRIPDYLFVVNITGSIICLIFSFLLLRKKVSTAIFIIILLCFLFCLIINYLAFFNYI